MSPSRQFGARTFRPHLFPSPKGCRSRAGQAGPKGCWAPAPAEAALAVIEVRAGDAMPRMRALGLAFCQRRNWRIPGGDAKKASHTSCQLGPRPACPRTPSIPSRAGPAGATARRLPLQSNDVEFSPDAGPLPALPARPAGFRPTDDDRRPQRSSGRFQGHRGHVAERLFKPRAAPASAFIRQQGFASRE